MSEYNLGGALELDAADFVDGAGEASEASGEFGDSAEETQDTLFEFDAAGAAAGGAIAGIGTAIQSTLDDTKTLRSELNQTAVTAGTSSDEMRDLATDIADAETPLAETSGMLATLAERGVTSEDKLASLSDEFATLAKATGTEAPRATQTAIQSMRAFGDDAEDIGEHMDTLTTVSRSTSLDFEEFGEVVGDVQPVIDDLGLSMDDVAAYMMALEEEGVNSQRAQELFAQAAESAEGDVSSLNSELGISEGALAAQRTELANAKGSTEEYAAAAESSTSTMDRLRSRFDEVKLAAGGVLEPVSAVAPAMQAAGIAAMAFSTINMSAVVPSLGAVTAGLGTVMATILPLVAIGALLYGAWKTNFLGIQDVVRSAISSSEGYLRDIVAYLQNVVPPILDKLGRYTKTAFKVLENAILTTVSIVMPILRSLFGYFGTAYSTYLAPLEADFQKTWNVIKGRIQTFFNWMQPFIKAYLNLVRTNIRVILGVLTALWNTFGDEIMVAVRFAFNTIKRIIDQVLDAVRTAITVALALIRGDWKGAWNAIAGYLTRTWDRISAQFKSYTKTVSRLFTGFTDGLIQLGKNVVTWFSGSWDIVDTVVGVLGDLKEDAVSTATEIFDGIVGVFKGIGDAIGDTLTTAFNSVVPDEIELPEVTIGGDYVGTKIGGKKVGGTLPEVDVGGGSFDLPQLDTGGFIEEDGPAFLHEGEQVVQEAQVSNRGKVEAGADADEVAAALETVSRDDEIVRLLERLIAAIRALEAGDVRQKDILAALDVARDRRSGRDPLGGD